jgi:SAM-dependent methyltransferase
MSAAGGDWGAGYVTDIAYLPGYYRHQSPLHLHVACLLGSVAGLDVAARTPLSYLELGCGYGFGALALAACNPAWQVTGIDFNPSHIATARSLAAEAGITNARFIEADLATLAESPLCDAIPEVDCATMHGLWSWVGDSVRSGIVRLFATKLRPGGVVHVSYNALPAWQGAIGLQRLLREAGRRVAGRSDRQVAAGLELLQALVEAKAHHLVDNSFAQAMIEHIRRAHPSYLAHEYMNATWRPCFHADVVADLAPAKLDWVASAHLLENFSPLTLSDEVRGVLERVGDPAMRELVKDLSLTRGLRQDVFVRGARRLSPAERDEALADVMLALTCHEDQFTWEVAVPSGQAALERDFYGPILGALAQRPQTVRELLALADLPRHDNPAEVVGMLVGTDHAMPVLGPPGAPLPQAERLNAVALRRLLRHGHLNTPMALALSGTGAPLSCPMLDLFLAVRLRDGQPADPARWAQELGPDQPEDERGRLRDFIERILTERAPVWRRLGLLPDPSCGSATR